MTEGPDAEPVLRVASIRRRAAATAVDGHVFTIDGSEFVLPDPDRLPWGLFVSRFGPFDRIDLDDVIGDLARPDLVLHGLLELLAPGGRLKIGTPVLSHADDRVRLIHGSWPPPWWSGERRWFTRSSLNELLEDCALSVVDEQVEREPVRSTDAGALLGDAAEDAVRHVRITTRRARSGAVPPPRTFAEEADHTEGFESGPGTCRRHEIELLAGHHRVLEVAPSRPMTEWLRAEGHDVSVVDAAAPSASRFAATRTVPMDLDHDPLPESLCGRFDAVLLHDVLERVLDPVAVLRSMGRCLAPSGVVVVSVRNAARAELRLGLAAGRWQWRHRSDLRFYVADTLRSDVEAAGFRPDMERTALVDARSTSIDAAHPPTDGCLEAIEADRSSRVHTMTWRLRPAR